MQSKTAHSFRDKYQAYWATWTERVLALPRDKLASSSSASRRADGHDILLTVIDQLVALSSMAVVNVRDAVTEAALCVARGVLASCTALKAEAETARRQINAEESTKSKAVAKQNPKYQFCLQQEAKAKKVSVCLHVCHLWIDSSNPNCRCLLPLRTWPRCGSCRRRFSTQCLCTALRTFTRRCASQPRGTCSTSCAWTCSTQCASTGSSTWAGAAATTPPRCASSPSALYTSSCT